MADDIQYDGKIITVPAVPLVYNKGVGQLFFEFMQKHQNAVAQIDGTTGEEDKYGSMLQRSIRTAITMRSKGVTSDDIISVCSFNHLDVHTPIIASIFLGAKFASIDPNFSLEDTVHLLKQVQPKMVFTSPNAVALIEAVLATMGSRAEIVVFGDTDNHTPFREFLDESPEEQNFAPREPENLKDTFGLFFSSGTTGLPKGVCYSHLMVAGMISLMWNSKEEFKGVILTYSSLYWVSSFFFLLIAIITGNPRVIVNTFDVEGLWEYIEKHKVFMLLLTANQIATVLSGEPPRKNISSLKFVTTGGANVSREQIDEFRKLLPGVLFTVGYGQTEMGGALSFRPTVNPKDFLMMLEKPESCGRPVPGYSYKIVDPITEEVLGMNQRGELRVKTEYQMNGYYNIDSSSTWDSEGYIKTGDVAYYDEQFCFYIVDRIKEIFKFRGTQVVPSKLEGILRTHPAVENAVVFGVPHPADDFHPTAVVILKPGARANPEEVRHYLESKVTDPQRLRGGIKIVDSIPETPSGKYRRNHTRDLFMEGKL